VTPFILPAAAILIGSLLFPLLYFIESDLAAVLGNVPQLQPAIRELVAPALLEELVKLALLAAFLSFGRLRWRPGIGTTRPPILDLRAQLVHAARRLGFGTVAIGIFSAVENLNYFLFFPGTGTFQRLIWSLPVHLVSALALSLGLFVSLECRLDKGSREKSARPPTSRLSGLNPLAAFMFAAVWHVGANALASASPDPRILAAGALANLAALVTLGSIYCRRVLIGGMTYGLKHEKRIL
jgi:hypothetical protein